MRSRIVPAMRFDIQSRLLWAAVDKKLSSLVYGTLALGEIICRQPNAFQTRSEDRAKIDTESGCILIDLSAHHPEYRLSLCAHNSPVRWREEWTGRKCVLSLSKQPALS
jgi:hypothetical protein